MRDFIENLDNVILDSLDMGYNSKILDDEHKKYYIDKSSKEHYRLLTYISSLLNNEIILDIGTFIGCSALALSTNKENKVISFDIVNRVKLHDIPNNIEFVLDDVTNGRYDELLLKSKLILLDTFHDGIFEKQFYNYLLTIQYSGILVLDDIFLNEKMVDFWGKIDKPKFDVTQYGHSTGTGIVFFDNGN